MTCALADGDCAGRLEWHHAIKQQRLKRAFPRGAWSAGPRDVPWRPIERHNILPRHFTLTRDEILGDTRNRVWLCSAHHESVTNGRLRVVLPDSVWEFAREFGLDGALENDLRRAA